MSDQIPRLDQATREERESRSDFRAILSVIGLELAIWIILGLIALVTISG